MKRKILISASIISSILVTSIMGIYGNETTAVNHNVQLELEANAPIYTESQLNGSYSKYETINLMDNGSTSSSDSVNINNNTITITSGGTYVVTGTLTNGQIVVNSEDDTVQVVLNGVNIHNEANAPIFIENSKKFAMITLMESTSNTLTDGMSYILQDEEEIDSVIYSKQDLIINGTGELNIVASYNDGIKSKDSIHIVSGTYNITSDNDAIYGKDAVTIDDGTFNIVTSTGAESAERPERDKMVGARPNGELMDGVPPMERQEGGRMSPNNGNMPFESQNSMENQLRKLEPKNEIEKGKNFFETGNTKKVPVEAMESEELTESRKGIKSKGEIVINDGIFVMDTYDDSINSGSYLEINDGEFFIKSGDDALKGDYMLTINDGIIKISDSYEAIEAKVIYLNGGTVKAISYDDAINASDPDAEGEANPKQMEGKIEVDLKNSPIIYFNGTDVTVNGSGDGIDANGSIIINDGNITIHGVNQGGEMAFDFDGTCIVNGGSLFVLGGNATFGSESTQNVISTSLKNTANEGETIKVTNSKGEVVVETIAEKVTNVISFSSDKIINGDSYTITYGNYSETIVASENSITNNNTSSKMGKGPGGPR